MKTIFVAGENDGSDMEITPENEYEQKFLKRIIDAEWGFFISEVKYSLTSENVREDVIHVYLEGIERGKGIPTNWNTK